jgi:hypothetical protein
MTPVVITRALAGRLLGLLGSGEAPEQRRAASDLIERELANGPTFKDMDRTALIDLADAIDDELERRRTVHDRQEATR